MRGGRSWGKATGAAARKYEAGDGGSIAVVATAGATAGATATGAVLTVDFSDWQPAAKSAAAASKHRFK